MDKLTSELEVVLGLCEKASPGEVSTVGHSWSECGLYADGKRIAVAEIDSDVDEDTQDELSALMDANAAALAAAVNFLRAHKDELRRLAGQGVEREALLAKIAEHEDRYIAWRDMYETRKAGEIARKWAAEVERDRLVVKLAAAESEIATMRGTIQIERSYRARYHWLLGHQDLCYLRANKTFAGYDHDDPYRVELDEAVQAGVAALATDPQAGGG